MLKPCYPACGVVGVNDVQKGSRRAIYMLSSLESLLNQYYLHQREIFSVWVRARDNPCKWCSEVEPDEDVCDTVTLTP